MFKGSTGGNSISIWLLGPLQTTCFYQSLIAHTVEPDDLCRKKVVPVIEVVLNKKGLFEGKRSYRE